jgi:hypothetical protein
VQRGDRIGHGAVVADYTDAAMSGASLMRPGIQALMRAALDGTFDLVLAGGCPSGC